MDVAALAAEINETIQRLDRPSIDTVRAIRRDISKQVRKESGAQVFELVLALLPDHDWFAYELVYHHAGALRHVTPRNIERLAGTLDNWGKVDAFCRYVSGPAWREGGIDDDVIAGWAQSADRWWRRAALVSTVPLNLRAAGGSGDVKRTLVVCEMLVADRDDMVVKALSWALRQLASWDRDAVTRFLAFHGAAVAQRVRREVTNKLATGLKNPGR